MNKELTQAQILLSIVNERSEGRIPADDGRTVFFATMFSLAVEHQESILILFATGQNTGTALALVRILADTVYRAFWAKYCATDDEYKAILDDKRDAYPHFAKMGEDLCKTSGFGTFFSSHAHAWSQLCSFTHSGMQQVGRRSDHIGNIRPNYAPELIVDAIKGTSGLLTAIAFRMFEIAGDGKAAELVMKAWQTYFNET